MMKYPEILRQKETRPWIFGALAVVAFAVGAAVLLLGLREEGPVRATISTGPLEEKRAVALLDNFVSEAKKHRLELKPIGTKGAFERIEEVEAGRLDFAFILGGFDFSRYRNLRQVAALHVHPLHLLVKEELADSVTTHLSALRGKTVNLGSTSNGAHYLARDALAFAGLRSSSEGEKGDYLASELTMAQMQKESDRDRMPDAMFFMASLPSSEVRDLVVRRRYRLIALPFHDAFALGALTEINRPTSKESSTVLAIRKEHVADSVIPAYTYQVDPGIPPTPLKTLGLRVLVIANKTLDPVTAERFIEAILSTRLAKLANPPLDIKRLVDVPELPLHAGVHRYLDRDKPILNQGLVDSVRYWTTIGLSGAGGLVCVRKWLQKRTLKITSLSTYMKMITAVERQAREQELAGLPDRDALVDLDHELTRIKVEAMEYFEYLGSKDVAILPGFLAHLNDAREYLARLSASCRA